MAPFRCTGRISPRLPGDIHSPEDCSDGRPNAIGWWSPIENAPMFTGLYLPAICERAKRSGATGDREKARRLTGGLLKCASVSDVPGFIARGGRHRRQKPLPSWLGGPDTPLVSRLVCLSEKRYPDADGAGGHYHEDDRSWRRA